MEGDVIVEANGYTNSRSDLNADMLIRRNREAMEIQEIRRDAEVPPCSDFVGRLHALAHHPALGTHADKRRRVWLE